MSSVVSYACKSAHIHENEIKKMNAIDLDPVGYVGSSTMKIVQLFRCAMWPVGLFSSLAKKIERKYCVMEKSPKLPVFKAV